MEEKRLSKEPIKGIQPDMAPKEQIQKHEWMKDIMLDGYYKCIHCGTSAYFLYSKLLYCKGGPIISEEPACITRPINAPQREADK